MSDTTVLSMSGTGATNSTANAVAAIDIPQDGVLLSALFSMNNNLNFTPVSGAHDRIAAELSFISTNQFGVNDRRGTIATIRTGAVWLTSGGASMSVNQWVQFGDGILVAGGERIYVHTFASDGPQCLFDFQIYFRVGRRIGRRSARRT